jgi:hypothetical protein
VLPRHAKLEIGTRGFINFEMKACAYILTLTLILMVLVEQWLGEREWQPYYLQAV